MGIVYMLCCKTTGETYYGSTTMDWKDRLTHHRSKSNGCVSRHIIARNDYEFVILEEVDDEQLRVREKYYITTFPCINKQSPFRTREEYLQYNKQYRQDHKEEIKQYRQDHKEERLEYDKQKYIRNKVLYNQKSNQYHKEHKDQIEQKQSRPYKCECGSIFRWSKKALHLRTKKHRSHTDLNRDNQNQTLG